MFTKRTFLLAGFLISLLTLLIAFYNIYQNHRNAEINYLTNKLESKKKALNTPLVSVQINSLEMLPDEIIDVMPFIPTSIEIENVRGEASKNITLDVISSVPIHKLKKWKSIERFNVSFPNPKHNRFLINIPELRRDTKIGLTLITTQVPKIDFKFFADKGELFDLEKESEKRKEILESLKDEIGGFVYKHSFLMPIPIESYNLITSSAQTNLDMEIELLEQKIRDFRTDNLFVAILKFLMEQFRVRPILLIVFAFTLIIALFALQNISYRYKGKKKYQEMLEKIRQYKIEPGFTLNDVIKLLGSPTYLAVSELDDSYLALHYYHTDGADFFKPIFLFVFAFQDSKLVTIMNEKKEELI